MLLKMISLMCFFSCTFFLLKNHAVKTSDKEIKVICNVSPSIITILKMIKSGVSVEVLQQITIH